MHVDLFSDLDLNLIDNLCAKIQVVDIEEGKDFFKQTGFKQGIVVILSGGVKWLALDVNGNHRIIKYFGDNDIVVLDKVLQIFEKDQYLESVTDSKYAYIPHEIIDEIGLKDPMFRFRLLTLIAKKADEFDTRVSRLMHNSVRERLGIALVELVNKFGLIDSNQLRLRFTKKELCQFLSASKSSVNRLLLELDQNNAIRFQKDRLFINNMNLIKMMSKGQA